MSELSSEYETIFSAGKMERVTVLILLHSRLEYVNVSSAAFTFGVVVNVSSYYSMLF